MSSAPARSRLESLQTLRAANLDAAFATAFITLTTGAFMVGFVQSLGGSDFFIGLLSAVPSLCGLLQIPGAIWGRGFPSFKPFVWPGGLIWRLLYIPIALLPLLPLPDPFRLAMLLVFVSLAAGVIVVVNPIYNDWLAELVPNNSRGFFWSRRNAIATAVGSTVGLLGGFALDAFKQHGREDWGFSFVYALGLVCSAISFRYFLKMGDVPRPNPIRQPIKQAVRAIGTPFGDRAFRPVLIFLAVAVTSQTLAGNLFAAFALKTLHLDYKIFQGASVMHAVGMVASAGLWGYLADKYGNKPLLMIAMVLLALNPVVWLLCRPHEHLFNASLLLPAHVFMGLTWSAVALCQFNLVLATANPDDRANYIAAGLTVITLFAGLAPFVGGIFVTALQETMTAEHSYKIVFGVVMGLRVVAMFFLIPVQEEGSVSLRRTLRDLKGMSPRGVRAVRGLSQNDALRREAAIQSVGDDRVSLATDEIIKALHDPMPGIRRQAAYALGRLRDPRAVGELIHQLQDHPDLVEEEILEALGDLRDPSAVPVLVPMLQHPSPGFRRTAAKALGKIGNPEAMTALVSVAKEPGDPDRRRAALQAIRQISSPEAAEAVISAIDDPHPSVRIAAAEAVSELKLTEAAPKLREVLSQYSDEGSSEIAYALGAVGTLDDLPAILDEAAESRSVMTRRRCLLGVARLLDCERGTYRLMLLESMARDGAMMELAKGRVEFTAALNVYSTGNEVAAVGRLADQASQPEFEAMRGRDIPELFLVALAAMAGS